MFDIEVNKSVEKRIYTFHKKGVKDRGKSLILPNIYMETVKL